MKALRLDFTVPGKVELDLTADISGEQALAQNMIVNFLTAKGSDAAYPAKGTNILGAGLQNLFIDRNYAQHFANFAAVDTLFFTRSTDYVDTAERAVVKVDFDPVNATFSRVVFHLGFTFANGVALSENLALK